MSSEEISPNKVLHLIKSFKNIKLINVAPVTYALTFTLTINDTPIEIVYNNLIPGYEYILKYVNDYFFKYNDISEVKDDNLLDIIQRVTNIILSTKDLPPPDNALYNEYLKL